jgi:hypothetical protein
MTGLLALVASVLSSTAAATIIGLSFSEAKERWALRRGKIEEIYLCAAGWTKSLSAGYLNLLRVCKGELTYNDMLDLELKGRDRAGTLGDLHLRMKMNICMYERSLVPVFESMQAEQRKTNKLRFAVADCWKKRGDAAELFDPLNDQLKALDAAIETLLLAIIERGVEIGMERGQLSQAWAFVKLKLARGATWVSQLAKGKLSRLLNKHGPDGGKMEI